MRASWRLLSSSIDPSRVALKNENGIVTVTLSRPEKLNGLDMPMFRSIAAAAAQLREDKSVRVVILCGEGKAFCTGLDVKSVATNPKNFSELLQKPAGSPISNLAQDVGYLWRLLPVPVIASLHGMCYGGGLQIALGADIRYATPDCKLSIMEAKWGLIPDMSASITLRELVRADIAKELTFTGRIIDGTEAARIGLVSHLADDPLAAAKTLANELVERSPDALASAKRLFQRTWVESDEVALKEETDLQKKLLVSWNQVAKSLDNFGVPLPYVNRSE
jgi:enoyl-CoA hydratase/carnithine racemase